MLLWGLGLLAARLLMRITHHRHLLPVRELAPWFWIAALLSALAVTLAAHCTPRADAARGLVLSVVAGLTAGIWLVLFPSLSWPFLEVSTPPTALFALVGSWFLLESALVAGPDASLFRLRRALLVTWVAGHAIGSFQLLWARYANSDFPEGRFAIAELFKNGAVVSVAGLLWVGLNQRRLPALALVVLLWGASGLWWRGWYEVLPHLDAPSPAVWTVLAHVALQLSLAVLLWRGRLVTWGVAGLVLAQSLATALTVVGSMTLAHFVVGKSFDAQWNVLNPMLGLAAAVEPFQQVTPWPLWLAASVAVALALVDAWRFDRRRSLNADLG